MSGSSLGPEALQLTEAVLANLTTVQLSNASLFSFAAGGDMKERALTSGCKTFPGDRLWPADVIWNVLDLLLGGSLIRATPVASPCYDNFDNYDAERCAFVADQWTNSTLQ